MATKLKFRTPFNKVRCGLSFEGTESRTEQSHKNECDINNIISKYDRTGLVTHRNEYRGQYGFASQQTFEDAMLVVARAQSMFNDLPAKVRDRFNHDPGQFLKFVQDDKNADELVKMGLATNKDDIASKTPQIDPAELRQALTKALDGAGIAGTGKDDEKSSDKKEPSKEG